MRHHPASHPIALWLALIAALLLSGCASLQVDVDVYKGPLAHERDIQIKQFASMATSAKPLLRELYCRQMHSDDERACLKHIEKRACDQGDFQARFLCGVLDLYNDTTEKEELQEKRPNSRKTSVGVLTRKGLDTLTQDVTDAMARKSRNEGTPTQVDLAVDALSESLIFFAQKVLYIANNELLFGDQPSPPQNYQQDYQQEYTGKTPQQVSKKNAAMIAVLQSLGNTLLVHANDLQRQDTRDEKHVAQARNEDYAVQQAFQPEPSATMAAIIARLEHFNASTAAASKDETIDTATPEQKAELERLRKEATSYLSSIDTLIAAYRTVVAGLPAPLPDIKPEDVDFQSADADRRAIAALYPNLALAGGDATLGTLKPLSDWLAREMTAGVVISPSRPARLAGLKTYLDAESARLTAAGVVSTDKRSDTLSVLRSYLTTQMGLAVVRYRELLASVTDMKSAIDSQDKKKREQLAELQKKAKADNIAATRTKTVAVVRFVHAEVLQAAEKINTRDPKVIHDLLLHSLEDLKTSKKDGKPGAAEIELTQAIVKEFKTPATPCNSLHKATNCNAKNTIAVVDNLIASLRAQRVQAIAEGDVPHAENLLKAINVAYEQRTAMIYLRPASDYLRSVYSSSMLQNGTDNEYRNMLVGWLKYLGTDEKGDGATAGRAQLEKIHWQNVNRVTLSGGGQTNYVLAKDDVGNWYVKAYSADPESIIKSATSLALFNSGKAINVNLLRRFELQRQLDDDKNNLSGPRRAALQKELEESHKQGGQALLKVRDRYAGRYQRETNAQASNLLVVLNELQTKAGAEMSQVKDWPESDTCHLTQTKEALKPLESKYLDSARAKLTTAIASQADLAKLPDTESSIQAALTAMHLYSSDAPRVTVQSKEATCETAQRSAGEFVRSYVRGQITTAASERKASIERYEDALSNILEIAGEK
jgi:hypothetical protein